MKQRVVVNSNGDVIQTGLRDITLPEQCRLKWSPPAEVLESSES